MNTRIKSIADRLDLVPVIAKWHWEEWGHHDPKGSLEKWTHGLAKRTRRYGIPTTFLALEGEEPIGSAVLVEHDMSTREDLSPWLAGVYVVPANRGRGVASTLVRHAMQAARDFGVETLYLYTNGAESFYRRLGWKDLERTFYEGREVTVMAADLGAMQFTDTDG